MSRTTAAAVAPLRACAFHWVRIFNISFILLKDYAMPIRTAQWLMSSFHA
jgi:hypothetical protein